MIPLLPTFFVPGFLTPEETKLLSSTINNTGRETRPLYQDPDGIPESSTVIWANRVVTDWPMVESLIGEKLRQVLGNEFETDLIWTLNSQTPIKAHTDYIYRSKVNDTELYKPWYTFAVSYHDYDSSTIVFNQWAEYNEISRYRELNPPLLEEQRIPQDYWDQNLNHLNPKNRKYLTIELECPWKIGTLIVWDRRRFHASSNFTNRGINLKQGLVSFTVRKK
jgi:hypothetical protein